MKTENIGFSVAILFCLVLVAGCTKSNKNLPSPSPTLSILIIPSPSPTSTPTASPMPTSTPTMIPALPVEEARTRLLELLSDNGSCNLPCLWGITPGKSDLYEARAILSPLSSLSHSVYLDHTGTGSITPRYTEDDLEIYTTVGFLTNPDDLVVNHIAFNAEAHRPLKEGGYEDIFDSKFFGERIVAFALSHVLSEQGAPSSIMISTYGGPLTRGGTGGFDILLLYPEQGILVNYTTQMQLIGTKVRGCPSNAHVEMELYPPGNSDSFFELLKQTDWAIKFSGYQPLEDVTSMSSKEFYDTFRQSADKCIETPTKLWPTQEP